MKVLFGQVNPNDRYDTDGCIPLQNKYYDYGVEIGTNPGGMEEVAVYDGLDRFIPVDIQAVPELIRALQLCVDVYQLSKVTDDFEQAIRPDYVTAVQPI